MRVAYISADFDGALIGGAGWYRCAVPAHYLADNGVATTVVASMGSLETGEIVPVNADGSADLTGYDTIVMQRWMDPDAPRIIRAARGVGQTVVQDVDDWFFGLDPSNRAFAATRLDLGHYRAGLAAASGITCSTDFLAAQLAKLAPTTVVRNAIDLARWPEAEEVGPTLPRVVGWVGATAWRSGDLETMRGILSQFLGRHRSWRFAHHGHMEGAPLAHELAGLPAESVGSLKPALPIGDYPSLFDGIGIGIVPLRDTPFNEAKSAIKAMEYAASGVPFVAAASTENTRFMPDRCARRPKDWLRLLEALVDPVNHKAAADAGRARVLDYDAAARWGDWLRAYEGFAR